ncbi:MAG: FAD-dependent oxidoreductase, partial [Deltaproteobacteria bacterium]
MTGYDLVVIGGGITGAGIARDAALRGMKVGLFEKADFASGTSSKSSKLIHGGLRYLEHGEIGLVFESVSERSVQMRVAPHLVRPLPFLIPIYKGVRPGFEIMNVG